jgi:hypothetical protein
LKAAPERAAKSFHRDVIGHFFVQKDEPSTMTKKRPAKALTREGTMNQKTGAVYQPELIELMRSVLDDAMLTVSEPKRTSAMRAEIASHILACAAKGERNPKALTMAALSAVVDCTHYSHDISPERRAV